jgi:hypothetical protein
MAVITPVTFNSGTTIDGTTQVGNLAAGTSPQDYSTEPGGLRWWATPDTENNYVIAHVNPNADQPNPLTIPNVRVGFWKTDKTNPSFISWSQFIAKNDGDPQVFTSGNAAKTWLNNNGYWTSYEYQNTSLSPTYYNVDPVVWPIYTPYNTSLYVVNGASPFDLFLVNSGYTVTSKQTNFLGETKQTQQDSTGRYLYYVGTTLKRYDVELNTAITVANPGGGSSNLFGDYDQSNNYLYAAGYNSNNNDWRMYRFSSGLTLLNSWVVTYSGGGSIYGVTFNPTDGLVYYGWGNYLLYALNPSTGSSSLKVTLNSANAGRALIVPETNEMYYRGTQPISGATFKTSICVVNLNDYSQSEYDVQYFTGTGPTENEIYSSAVGIAYDTSHNLVWYKQPTIGFKGIDISSKQVYVSAPSSFSGTTTIGINYETNELVGCYALLANKGFQVYDLSSL